jgi:hypothetical protein
MVLSTLARLKWIQVVWFSAEQGTTCERGDGTYCVATCRRACPGSQAGLRAIARDIFVVLLFVMAWIAVGHCGELSWW